MLFFRREKNIQERLQGQIQGLKMDMQNLPLLWKVPSSMLCNLAHNKQEKATKKHLLSVPEMF